MLRQTANHSFENKEVEGDKAVPIQSSPQSTRSKSCGLMNRIALNSKFQPRFSGQLHFSKKEQAFFLYRRAIPAKSPRHHLHRFYRDVYVLCAGPLRP